MAHITANTTRNRLKTVFALMAVAIGATVAVASGALFFRPETRTIIAGAIDSIAHTGTVDPAVARFARDAVLDSLDGTRMGDAALISYDAAVKAGLSTINGREWINRAVSDSRRALARSPGNAFGWTRLSLAAFNRDGPAIGAASALNMSIMTSRNNARLAPTQLALSEALWSVLGPDGQFAVMQLVRNQWAAQSKRDGLKQLASSETGRAILREAFASDPLQQSAIEAWLTNGALKPTTN
jgi:hypothetical protein